MFYCIGGPLIEMLLYILNLYHVLELLKKLVYPEPISDAENNKVPHLVNVAY
jgi:hypothetical protein